MNEQTLMAPKTRFYRYMALSCYLALLVWMPIWHFMLASDTQPSPSLGFILVVYCLPLLLPLKGIIQAKPYTHAWTNFLAMCYLIHGLTSYYAVPDEALWAFIEIILVTGMFTGCSMFARLRGKELGLGIRKLKEELAEEHARFSTETKN
jgi:uncharacterized membrane protein